MTRDLLELTQKKKVFVQWEPGQVMWEEYKVAAHRCKEKILADKVQLELYMANTVWDNKKILK